MTLRPLALCVFAAVLMLQGCKDESTPRAIQLKSDARIKRADMSSVAPAISKK
ncbi:MAG: hypothetical protein WCL32_08520 [Planctomycetota bacterium]|jgi:hypothetical protein